MCLEKERIKLCLLFIHSDSEHEEDTSSCSFESINSLTCFVTTQTQEAMILMSVAYSVDCAMPENHTGLRQVAKLNQLAGYIYT